MPARLALGTAALALPYGPADGERRPPGRAEALRCLAAAADRGVDLVDTAPAYGDAEALVGEALGGSSGVRVATKVGAPPGGWAATPPAALRAWVHASVDRSLRALRRDRVDVLQVHNVEAEVLGRRPDLVEALLVERDGGRAATLGATVYGEANALAVVAEPALQAVQVALSALDRRMAREVLPAAAARAGFSVVARSVLLRGTLSAAAQDLPPAFAPLRAAVEALRAALGASWAQLPGAAVAVAAGEPGVGHVLLGPRDAQELTTLVDGARAFAGAAARLDRAALPPVAPALLDPSAWPR